MDMATIAANAGATYFSYREGKKGVYPTSVDESQQLADCQIPNGNFNVYRLECPSPTLKPSVNPTVEPSMDPSTVPTMSPSLNPVNPTQEPTMAPSGEPTMAPTKK